MTGRAMQGSVFVRRRRIMVGTDWIAGAKPKSFKCAMQDMREPSCDFIETPERALSSRRRCVNQEARTYWVVRFPWRDVDPLPEGARWITAVQISVPTLTLVAHGPPSQG
jgi:hypothetical protein